MSAKQVIKKKSKCFFC